jgi:hypothetical protein
MRGLAICHALAALFFATTVCLGDEPAAKTSESLPPVATTSCGFNHRGGDCSFDRRLASPCHCVHNWRLICDWLSYRPGNTEGPCGCCLSSYPPGCHPPLYLYFLYNCADANGCGNCSHSFGKVRYIPPAESAAKAAPAPLPVQAEEKIARKPDVATPKGTAKEASSGVGLVTWEDQPSAASDSGSAKSSSSWFGKLGSTGMFGSHTGFFGSQSSTEIIYEP